MKEDKEILKEFRKFLINHFLYKMPITTHVYHYYCGEATLYANIGYRRYWADFINKMCEYKKDEHGIGQYFFKSQNPELIIINNENEIDDLYFTITGRFLKDEQ